MEVLEEADQAVETEPASNATKKATWQKIVLKLVTMATEAEVAEA